jgi:hypothetical protein
LKKELKINDSKIPEYREFFNSKFSLNSSNKIIINKFKEFDYGGEVYERSPIELSADQIKEVFDLFSKILTYYKTKYPTYSGGALSSLFNKTRKLRKH